MRSMNFHDTKPRVAGAARCFSKCFHHLSDTILGESLRDSVSLRERQGAWCEYLTPAPLGLRYQPAPIPRSVRAGLAPCMGELDAGHSALLTDEAGDPRKRLNVLVTPDPQILRADTSFGRNGR